MKDSHNGYLTKYLSLGVSTPYNGLYGEAPPERGTFYRLQRREGFCEVKVYERVGKICHFGL